MEKTGNSGFDKLPSELQKADGSTVDVDALRKKYNKAKKAQSKSDDAFFEIEDELEALVPTKFKSGKLFGDPCVILE